MHDHYDKINDINSPIVDKVNKAAEERLKVEEVSIDEEMPVLKSDYNFNVSFQRKICCLLNERIKVLKYQNEENI